MFEVINSKKSSAYGLWFPDVRRYFLALDWEEDVMKNAIAALLIYPEGEKHLPARQAYEVVCNLAVAKRLAFRLYLISIPLMNAKHRTDKLAGISVV